ncbi:MAG: class I SAM-dependent methyltransferase [Clostridia bacterium]|nr:class I SAM-dependent methyltransferase [Clostridia bacterium]
MNQYDVPDFFAAYAQMSRSMYGLSCAGEWHQFEKLFPALSGLKVLDLGCGYGWHCKYAVDHGALHVTGIDQSRLMIDEAIHRNPDKRIEYRVCSLLDFDYPEEAYDLVISNLVLHYVKNLDTVYERIFKTLQSGGAFLMNIEHPTFTSGVNQQFSSDGSWPVHQYFYSGKRQTMFLGHRVTKYHHTLTQILMGLIQAGFRLTAVEEAMPPETWRHAMPEEYNRPMMLLVRADKP